MKLRRFFLDTEFIEPEGDHYLSAVELISIGIVDDTGREYYAVSSGFRYEALNPWLRANVLPHLGDPEKRLAPPEIRQEILQFVGQAPCQFWGYYADYDWYLFCRLMGGFMGLPNNWMRCCYDVRQFQEETACPTLPAAFQPQHNALVDARWTKAAWERVENWRNK